MKLLVIRHAKAGDRKRFARETGKPDDFRPVTREGRNEMKRVAAGLATLEHEIGFLLTSPLTRAVETAEIVRSAIEVSGLGKVDQLRPDRHPRGLLSLLRRPPMSKEQIAAVVGHEPHLGRFVSWALTGTLQAVVALEKGGACLLEFPGPVREGEAVLEWLLTPRQLKAMLRKGP